MTNTDQKAPGFFERFRWAYLFFLIVAAVMLRSSKIFQTKSGMAEPQFGFKGYDPIAFEDLTSYFREEFMSFKVFFIADLFFMLSLCWITYTLYKKIKPRDSILGRFKIWIPRVLIGAAALTIIANSLENYFYLSGNLWFSAIETIKSLLTGIFILVFLVYVFINADKGRFLQARKFLRSSYISIIILILIGFGLTLLPQGATLIVHLFEDHNIPGLISIICSVFFVNILAIILSHYPKYMEFRQDDDKTGVDWHMTEQWKGFGIITYHMKKSDDIYLVFGRYCLGILAYVAWFYIIYKAFALYGLTWFDPFAATVICATMYLIFAGYFFFKFNREKAVFYDKVASGTIVDADLETMRKWVRLYVIWLLSTIIFGTIGLYIYWHFGWHVISYVFSLCFIFCNANCFLLFRLTRSSMTLARANMDHIRWVKEKDFAPQETIDKLASTFHKKRDWSYFLRGRLWNYLTDFSSNYIFLRRLQAAGFIALFLLIVSNLFLIFGDVTIFSSIPIFLAFLVNVYAIFILYVKHMIFYNDYENTNYYLHRRIKKPPGIDRKGVQLSKESKNRFVLRLAIIPVLVIGILIGIQGINNFHRMDFTYTKNQMRIQEYANRLEAHVEEKGIRRLAKVASFGGGLKSNLWNLLVLNQLDTEVKKRGLENDFLDHCFSFSGVSGGAVGLGNYLAIDYSAREYGLDKWQAIDDIGNENVLAIDMAGLFMHDPFFNTVKFSDSRNKDRSFYAMEQYIKVISNGNEECMRFLSDSSQQHVWHEMYKSRGHIPALIINTASTGPNPGVAFSLESKYLKNRDRAVFPGYILLEDENLDLRYYDAVSTSNRFPIMSPAAQVDDKGSFLDGGYFDNSGLLTSSYFQKFLRLDSKKLDAVPVITINVINSKSDYIRKFLGEQVSQDDINIKSSSNVGAIISGISDINKLPNVLRDAEGRYVEGHDKFMSIYLPHLITTTDIENLYGGKVNFIPEILEEIQKNNDEIRNAITDYAAENGLDVDISKHGIVEPPLARTLSKYAVIYQQAMITNFDGTQQEIKEIIDWLEK